MRFLVLLIGVLFACPANANLILSIENIIVSPGSTNNLLGVFASSNTRETLQSFNLTIDFGNNGRGMPAGFAFPGGTLNNADIITGPLLTSAVTVTGIAALPAPPFTQNYEGVFNASGQSLALSSTPTKLFDILVDVSALSGSIPVSIRIGNNPALFQVQTDALLRNEVVTTDLTLASGSITVVPEPGSCLMLAGALVAGCANRWRKKRKAFSSTGPILAG